MKTKDETFGKFKQWKTQVELSTIRKIRYLRTNNGLEFCNEVFNEYCRDQGITRHRTISYAPQHNGLAERMNTTILEKS